MPQSPRSCLFSLTLLLCVSPLAFAAPLENETSLDNLAIVDGYFRTFNDPGLFSDETLLPSRFGELDLERIIHNPQVLRVYAHLCSMPKKQAAILVNQHLQTALQEYNQLLKQYLKKNEEQFKKQQDHSDGVLGGPTFIIGNVKDGQPTLLGKRFQVLSLLYLAGNLQLTGTATTVHNVVNKAQIQYQELANDTRYAGHIALGLLRQAGLYSRQILALALLGTAPADIAQELTTQLTEQKKLTTTKFPPYDSPVTLYNQNFWPGSYKINYGKHPLHLPKLGPLNDKEFQSIQQKTTPPNPATPQK